MEVIHLFLTTDLIIQERKLKELQILINTSMSSMRMEITSDLLGHSNLPTWPDISWINLHSRTSYLMLVYVWMYLMQINQFLRILTFSLMHVQLKRRKNLKQMIQDSTIGWLFLKVWAMTTSFM